MGSSSSSSLLAFSSWGCLKTFVLRISPRRNRLDALLCSALDCSVLCGLFCSVLSCCAKAISNGRFSWCLPSYDVCLGFVLWVSHACIASQANGSLAGFPQGASLARIMTRRRSVLLTPLTKSRLGGIARVSFRGQDAIATGLEHLQRGFSSRVLLLASVVLRAFTDARNSIGLYGSFLAFLAPLDFSGILHGLFFDQSVSLRPPGRCPTAVTSVGASGEVNSPVPRA